MTNSELTCAKIRGELSLGIGGARFAYLRLLYVKRTVDSARGHSPSGWRAPVAKKEDEERRRKSKEREGQGKNSERIRSNRAGCKGMCTIAVAFRSLLSATSRSRVEALIGSSKEIRADENRDRLYLTSANALISRKSSRTARRIRGESVVNSRAISQFFFTLARQTRELHALSARQSSSANLYANSHRASRKVSSARNGALFITALVHTRVDDS